ncbi:MAG: hypothetical protein ISS44_04100 [Candidatus Omnitrophica bacterium]|nr:hypothetical protein [Candidatus Omnitrophota bacterium]
MVSKKFLIILMMGMVSSFICQKMAFSETTTAATLSVQAKIEQSVEVSYVIFEGAPADGNEADSMAFDVLTDRFPGDTQSRGCLFSEKWFTVMVFVGVVGGPQYELTQTATALSSGTAEIPTNAYLCTPVYAQEDEWQWEGGKKAQGPQPAASSLHEAGSAVEANKKIYTSEPNGSARIIQIVYSITNGYKSDGSVWPGFTGEPIPLNLPPGQYTGTITITLTTL